MRHVGPLGHGQDEDRGQNKNNRQDGQGHGLVHRRAVHGEALDHDLLAPLDLGGAEAQQHAQGRGLDAAGAGSWRAADDHEQDEHEEGRVRHDADVHGVEPGRAGRDGLEEALQHGREEPVLALLDAEKDGPADEDEPQAGADDQRALPAQAPRKAPETQERAEEAGQFHQDVEADAPQEDEEHEDEVHGQVAGEAHEVVRVEGETGVAEGRDGVEEGPEPAHLATGEGLQRHGPGGLDAQADHEDVDEEPPEPEGRVAQKGLAHGQAVREGHAPAPEVEDQARVGHDAQAADVDQHGQDEGREGRARVHHRQPRDTGGRDRGEHGVDPGNGRPVL